MHAQGRNDFPAAKKNWDWWESNPGPQPGTGLQTTIGEKGRKSGFGSGSLYMIQMHTCEAKAKT